MKRNSIISIVRSLREMVLLWIIMLSILFNYSFIAAAQDDHYWSQQYGAESTLMLGAMVGGVNDNSAVYYNPGALAFINNPNLAIDANVYRMDKILIKDGAGQGLNLNSAQIRMKHKLIKFSSD